MADVKRGRRPDSPELKAAKLELKSAKSDDERSEIQAQIEAIKVSERAARLGTPGPALTEDELFNLLIEREPLLREAERVAKEAADAAKAERAALTACFGDVPGARKRLTLFRRALTEEGAAEARAIIEMQHRVEEWQERKEHAVPSDASQASA